MQPNNQQGYYQPGQGRPAQPPTAPAQSAPAASPTPAVDPAAMQAVLNEPAPVQNTPAPTPAPAPAPAVEQPVVEQEQFGDPLQDGDMPEEDLEEPITWSAHEYIHQEKGALWFLAFAVVVIALGAVSLFLMKSWTFAALLVVIALVVIVYSRRPPRELTYSLGDEGLMIDDTLHKFATFKSFGVIRDGEQFSVMLIPIQRFQPGITVYFPEEAGEDIVDILGSRLPMKELHLDVIDRIVRLLRL